MEYRSKRSERICQQNLEGSALNFWGFLLQIDLPTSVRSVKKVMISKVIQLFGEILLWRYQREAFVRRFKVFNAIWHRWPIDVEFDKERDLYKVSDLSSEFWVSRSRRLVFYSEGIGKRLNRLASQYLIDRVSLKEGDVVLDVGANVGEIGVWLRQQELGIVYLAVEPSMRECKANKVNNPETLCFDVGAWNQSGRLDFFDRNDTGDSSVFKINEIETGAGTSIRAERLDRLLVGDRFRKIKLMKLEAEGAEPEVIEGAKGLLTDTEFISVDCGFERGAEEKSTADDVVGMLSASGFICIGCNPERLIFLFKNNRF